MHLGNKTIKNCKEVTTKEAKMMVTYGERKGRVWDWDLTRGGAFGVAGKILSWSGDGYEGA